MVTLLGGLLAMLTGLLHDLIQLCHPDRHSGRVDLATRVTQQLLELREQPPGGAA